MTPSPLRDARVVEVARGDPFAVTPVAVAFAGRLMAALGARVTRVVAGERDPLRLRGPFLPDGESALDRFLSAGKTTAREMPSPPGLLVCDDPELAQRWSGATVTIEAARAQPRAAACELTVLAASGLLDIVGERGAPPLPLPGHQTAYAAGIAAFDALACAHFAAMTQQPPLKQSVSVLDVALWLNWKHYLAAYLRLDDAGIARAEEWKTYRCRDGYIAFVFQDKDIAAIVRLTGDARLGEPRFATARLRRSNIEAFSALVAEWASRHTRDEIVAQARSMALPIGPVLAIRELLDDRQMRAREFIDLARGSPTFGMPRLPATWMHAPPERPRTRGAGAAERACAEQRR